MKTREAIEARIEELRDLIRKERTLRDRTATQGQWWVVDRRMKARIREVEVLQWVLTPTEA